ncbi:MAG: efflux RND transporter periplasmic adaptor subunit [Succinivibrio sp.]|nr:efflux RND transporter periplasmic adaptor subunit [Succinivibrio sp.]
MQLGKAAVLLGSLCCLVAACQKAPEQNSSGKVTPEVEYLTLKPQDVEISRPLNGVVSAFESADIRPQVSGIIRDQLFSGGEMVKKGQPLYQIDDRPFKNRYALAEAEYLEACAKLDLALSKLKRYQNLSNTRSVSAQELEDVKAGFAEAEAKQKISLANFNDAKLNLEYTRVLSPISGFIDKSRFTKGALVTANQTEALTTVVDISEIYIDLQMSADEFRRWQIKLHQGLLTVPEGGFKVRLNLGAGEQYENTGVLKFSEVQVDESSGNLTLRALFANPDHMLLPGMNLTASVNSGIMHHSLLVPEKALIRDAKGRYFVYVLTEGKVERRRIEAQLISGGQYLVIEGLDEGQQVVVSGKNQLRDGLKVKAHESEP